jgi:very-short-patch-repair endonuclease
VTRIARARRLRRDATAAERKLWLLLRDRRLDGRKFVRQFPIGPFIADFVCRSKMLIVEVDGATHSSEAELARDRRRTAWLEREGYRILRVRNAEVFEEAEGVLATILVALRHGED